MNPFFVSDEAKVIGACPEDFAQNFNFTLFRISNGAGKGKCNGLEPKNYFFL
jgi:hypothetical protein